MLVVWFWRRRELGAGLFEREGRTVGVPAVVEVGECSGVFIEVHRHGGAEGSLAHDETFLLSVFRRPCFVRVLLFRQCETIATVHPNETKVEQEKKARGRVQ